MRKKKKNLSDITEMVESVVSNNTIKGVRVLGVKSKNNRIYPVELMKKSLHLYENAVVNLDHPTHDKSRSVKDVFGKLVNPRIVGESIVADLEFNPNHDYAPAFTYFAEKQPGLIGLSHEAIARTRMDNVTGEEIVEEITELEGVSLVATPATNPNGLFESYNRIMESFMKKKDAHPEPADMDVKADEVTVVEPGKKVHVPEEEKEYGSHEEFLGHMKEEIKKHLASGMSHEDMCEAIVSMFVPHGLDEAEFDTPKLEEGKDSDSEDGDDDMKKKKAEESIRKSDKLGFKLLVEELDAYRTREMQAKLHEKIMTYCKTSGLPDTHVTEAFVDVLASVSEDKWAKLCEDRKALVSSVKSPISVAAGSFASKKNLTVDELMNALRS
jgi:hypothetical protein